MNRISISLSFVCIVITGILLGAANKVRAQDSAGDVSITITEYSDYECPACAYYHPMVKKLKEEFGDQIKLDLKFYPLTSHQFSALAARAAQAAKNQDKFMQMHNLLFEHQRQWVNSGNPSPIFMNFARELNLDMEQFKNDLNAAETQKTVMEQKREGRQAGVRATPTFIIEGDRLTSLPRTYAEFEKIVQKYLDEKEGEG